MTETGEIFQKVISISQKIIYLLEHNFMRGQALVLSTATTATSLAPEDTPPSLSPPRLRLIPQ